MCADDERLCLLASRLALEVRDMHEGNGWDLSQDLRETLEDLEEELNERGFYV